jgi:serine/threonine protein kinase
MTPERMQRLLRVFEQVIDQPADQLDAFLHAVCEGDAELMAEVRSLLHHDKKADAGFLGPTVTHSSPSGTFPDDPAEAVTPGSLGAPPLASFIPGYEILREISHGGQGVVYEAMQSAPRRRVAVKVLLDCQHSPAAQRRFAREIDLIAHLRHPNIISVFHSGTTSGGRPFYVMDFVAGEPLDRFVRMTGMGLEEALRLFVIVCDAVQYAHQKGVLHRDLKPSNVVVDRGGVPHILDLGLAKRMGVRAEPSISMTREVLGTLPFMSPEQAAGRSEEVDTRTDVYALGVMLYQLLTGKYPFATKGNVSEAIHSIMEESPCPPTRAWTPESGIAHRTPRWWRADPCPIDHELETIVYKALAKERERRYQSAGEFARDVEHYLAGEPIEARRDSIAYILWKQSRRLFRRTPVVALGLLCAILAPGLVASLVFWRNASRERDVAQAAMSFLNQDVFQALDPEQMGRGVDLRTVLDAASPQIAERFGAALATEAAVRQSVGNLYAGLGDHVAAQRHLERALELRRTTNGSHDLDVAETLASLSQVLEIRGRMEEAERHLNESFALRSGRLGEEHALVQTTLSQLAAFAERRGDLERAALWRKRLSSPLAGQSSASFGSELSKAVTEARQGLAAARRQHGSDHPQVAQQLVELSDRLIAAGHDSESETLLTEALTIYERQFGSEHPRTRQTFAKLEDALHPTGSLAGVLSFASGRLEQALATGDNARLLAEAAWDVAKHAGYPAETYQRALQAAQRACALDPGNGAYLNTLGALQYRCGQYPEALETLRTSDRLNAGHPADMAFLAMTCERLGQHEEARRELARLKALVDKAPWTHDRQTARLLREAGLTLGQSGTPNEGAP